MAELRRFNQQALTPLVPGTPQPYSYAVRDPLRETSTISPSTSSSRGSWYHVVSERLDHEREVGEADLIAAKRQGARLNHSSREISKARDTHSW